MFDSVGVISKSRFYDITVEKYHRIIQRLGKFLFMDALAKYEEEYMARTENYPPVILFEEVEGHVQEAEKLWELSVIPDSVKNEFYQYAQDCIDDLVNNPKDYEQFFETYFLRMKVVYHKNKETNEVSKFFGGQMILTVDVLSNMNYHRDKIISFLVKELS